MSDVLKGMTSAEARALAERAFRYAAGNPALTIDEVQKACALAALGAEVVGATEAVVWAGDCDPEPPRDPSWDYWQGLKRRVLVLEGE